LECYK